MLCPMHIALVTCDRFPTLYGDEQALPAAFAAAGHAATVASWSDPGVDWRAFDRVVIRNTWDYFERIDEFRAWLDRIDAAGVRLCNPLPLVRWNLDKRYLVELARRGVRVVATELVERGARVDLAALVARAGWHDAIVKPTVSGGSFRTHRFAAADAGAHQAALDEIVAASAAMVQPFVPEIATEGEWSLLFFGGELSHTVIKKPAAGDFRVQVQYGGSYVAATPPPSLVADARAVIAALPFSPEYVRIDGVRRDDHLVLMEVEAIEPYLFLPFAPDGAAARYVAAITG
jgi:glutathione synthase/RimK-type ligase-like ATP-grasp enzyme